MFVYEKKKKLIWKILLIVGIIPFAVALVAGIYHSLTGFSGICILDCNYYYGFKALKDSIILYSFIFWPTYIIGAFLILLSIFKLRNKKGMK